jgi:lipoprotein-releasing system permease protein
VIRLSMAGIAIGLAVMIIAIAIVTGFKQEVRNKVIGFGSHIRLTNFDSNNSYESKPIVVGDSLLHALNTTKGVVHTEIFATKPGIIKTDNDFQGIVLKGVSNDYDTTFLKKHLVEGQMINIDPGVISNQTLVSETLAKMLRLKCGDSFLAYFVNSEDIRARKLYVSGIYNTGFSDYDKLFVICDIKHIRRLNGWDSDMASGVEIFLDDYDNLDGITEELYFSLIDKTDRLANTYYIRSIKELNPMIFNWLEVLDSNVILLLVLMILVAGFTMISGLLIIILERTNMIGILKSLGESNGSIRKIFLYVSMFLTLKGMFWGNITGIAFCVLQSYFQWFKLNPETYYIDSVPIEINILQIILVNVCTLFISLLLMIAPSYLVAKIEPAKSIKFE